jgi:GNAT superfamily N-acetyltransferase
MRIVRWAATQEREKYIPALDRIFFESSHTKSFPSEEARQVFRQRWLGRFLSHYPEWAYLAIAPSGDLAGYLVASTDDPAHSSLFEDIGYFRDLTALTAAFPAQLHVNLAPQYRGAGWGSKLIDALVSDLRSAGISGVHVVTSRGDRNARFYEANSFREMAAFTWRGRELVFLARELRRDRGA